VTDEIILEVGIRIDPSTGVSFFGVEAVNRQLAAGRRIRELRPGGAIVTDVRDGGGDSRPTLRGCDLRVVFEPT
jgi:hypothetical protein